MPEQTSRLPRLFETESAHLLLRAVAQPLNVQVTYLDSRGARYSEPQEDSAFCRLVKTTDEGKRRCRDCEMRLLLAAENHIGDILVETCHAGLPSIATVVGRDSGTTTGVLFLQFLNDKPDAGQWRAFLALGRELDLKPERVAEAVNSMPIVPLQKVKEAADALSRVARELRCAADREELVYQIGGAILNSPSLDRALQDISGNMVRILGDDINFGIFVLDRLSRELVLRAGHGKGPNGEDVSNAIARGFSLDMKTGLVGWVASNKATKYCPNVRDREVASIYRQIREYTQSEFDVPLVYQDTLVGVINVESPRLDGLSEGERNKVEVIARYAAAAIAFTENLNTLSRFTHVLHKCEGEDQVVKTLLQAATAQSGLSFNRAAYFDLSKSGPLLTGRFAIGEKSADDARTEWARLTKEPDSIENIYLRSEQGWVSTFLDRNFDKVVVAVRDLTEDAVPRAIATGRGVKASGKDGNLVNVLNDRSVDNKLLGYFETRECVVVPVLPDDGGAVCGVVYADNAFSARAISDCDIAILELLARQCASLFGLVNQRRVTVAQVKKREMATSERFGHTLRNIMQEILGPCESALEAVREQNSLDSIREEIRSLQKSIPGFISALRGATFDPDRDSPAITSCHIKPIVEGVVERNGSRANRKSVKINLAIESDGDVEISTDWPLVTVILQTLIKNAIDYSRDGGCIHVCLARGTAANEVVITIQDQGIGFELDWTRLQAGQRGTEASKMNGDGHGVDLWNARRLARTLNAELHIEPRDGGGTKARLCLR